jgi:transposase, IS5 family
MSLTSDGRTYAALQTPEHAFQKFKKSSAPPLRSFRWVIRSMRCFTRLSLARGTLQHETTILNFRHLLVKHVLADQSLETVNELLVRKGLMLKQGTIVDATIIAAPSSTKNDSGTRDPEMLQTKKENRVQD